MSPRFPQRFGDAPAASLGVEEELFVVDQKTLQPAALPDGTLAGERRKRELFREMVELATPVVQSAGEAGRELTGLRSEARAALAQSGLALLAAATHPLAVPGEQELTPVAELARFAEYAGPAARVQYCCGLHVHVAVPSAGEAMLAIERALPWLPVLLALSANSPFAAGEPTGYESTRADLLARLPRTGAPPAFESFAAWERFAARLVDLGLADDYRRAWWDVRPHPRLGTVEVRIFDQPTRTRVSAAFVAAARALVCADWPVEPADRGVYAENRFAASRFGRRARLVHPDGSRLCPAPELAGELLERLRPAAERLGDAAELERLAELAARSQADEQHAIAQSEGVDALARSLCAVSHD